MRSAGMIAVAAMLGSSAWAEMRTESQKVVVCIEGGGYAGVEDAEASASRLLRAAGVKLEWHAGLSFCKGKRDQAITVTLSTKAPKNLHPGALAYALPFEGVQIHAFYDRIAVADPELFQPLLTYTLVHEIGHILQGVDRHSNSGIMKALWTPSEHELMKRGQLTFTKLDVELIQDGLAARASRRAAGTLAVTLAP